MSFGLTMSFFNLPCVPAPRRLLTALTLTLTLLAASGIAQEPRVPAGDGASSAKAFGLDLSARLKAKGAAPAENALHYVFLVDTSQADTLSPLVIWNRDFIKSFLSSLVEFEGKARLPAASRSLVSLHPYQLDLYREQTYAGDPTRGTWALEAKTLGGDEVGREVGLLRGTIPFRPNGEPYRLPGSRAPWFGHDNVGPRTALLSAIGPSRDGRPNVVVQITPNPLNEAPGREELGRRIANPDPNSMTAGIAGAGYELLLATEYEVSLPDGTRKRMSVWAYTPLGLSTAPKIGRKPGPAPPPSSFPPPPPSHNALSTGPFLGLLGLLGVGGLWYAFARKTKVEVGGTLMTVRTTKPTPVILPLRTGGDPQHVADLKLSPLASAPVLEAVGCTLQIDGSQTDRYQLRRNSLMTVVFSKGGTNEGSFAQTQIRCQ